MGEREHRVLVMPPSRRDGEVTCDLLRRSGIAGEVHFDVLSLAREIEAGAGAVVLTDAALASASMDPVLDVLKKQPPWSDLPVVLLCETAAHSPLAARIINSLTNVTLLDRPTSARSLVSAVQAALRARVRQYQTRDQLEALRRAEEALRARERELHIADRRKNEFLAMLAHELRNPLAPIRTAGELLIRMLPKDAPTQPAAAIIKRQVMHLSRLVDDLLDVSRITQGRIELQWQRVDLTSVIAQAAESVEPLLRDKRHRFFGPARTDSIFVNGDSARLVQCVSNVLTNAAKYTDPGGEIRVDLHAENGLAVISIRDNGVGIPRDMLPQIFDLFVQSDLSRDRSQGGLGIGLSVVQRLIAMHGGSVRADSDGPGRGSTFEIRLPQVAEQLASAAG